MPKRCAVRGCSRTNADGISLYSFPRENLGLCQEWVDFVRVKRSDFLWPSHTSVVCSLHFDAPSFEHNIKEVLGIKCRLRLVDGAVPTIQTAMKKKGLEDKGTDKCEDAFESEPEVTEKEERDLRGHLDDHEPFECNVEIVVDEHVSLGNENVISQIMHPLDEISYKCNECGEEFIKKRKFVQHIIGHSSDGQLKRNIATAKSGDRTNTELSIITPEVAQPVEKMCKCEYCGDEFSQKQNLVHHLLLSHSKEKLVQNKDQIFDGDSRICEESEALSQKVKSIQEVIGVPDFQSDQSLPEDPDTHQDHSLTENVEDQSHKCNECGKVFSRRSNLNQHLLKHTGVRPHNCNECGKQFFQRRDLTRHMVTHTGYQPYTCNECGKSFSHKGDLTRHTMNHTGFQPYKCDICGKTFSRRHDSEKHMFVHTDERPYKCVECGKGFSQRSRLTQHMLNHTGERPHKCTECGKAYLSKLSLTRHLPVHAGYKPFECDECNKAFYRKDDLAKHLLVHTGNLPFSCTECRKMFARKQTLTVHMLTHTGERPHHCSECDATYKYKVDLTNHLKKKHNITISSKHQRSEDQMFDYPYESHISGKQILNHDLENQSCEENINHHDECQNSEEVHSPSVCRLQEINCQNKDLNKSDHHETGDVGLKGAPDHPAIEPRIKTERMDWEKYAADKNSIPDHLVKDENSTKSNVKMEPPDI